MREERRGCGHAKIDDERIVKSVWQSQLLGNKYMEN